MGAAGLKGSTLDPDVSRSAGARNTWPRRKFFDRHRDFSMTKMCARRMTAENPSRSLISIEPFMDRNDAICVMSWGESIQPRYWDVFVL